MARVSAGFVLHRTTDRGPEVLLVHPGGPLWARKDAGAWSIPKGELDGDEDPEAAARREFREELGSEPPPGPGRPLGEIRQAGGKRVLAWALAGDLDVGAVVSGTFQMPWPPRSGRMATFPEVDRAEWFTPAEARDKLNAGQVPFLDRLAEALGW